MFDKEFGGHKCPIVTDSYRRQSIRNNRTLASKNFRKHIRKICVIRSLFADEMIDSRNPAKINKKSSVLAEFLKQGIKRNYVIYMGFML